MNKLIDEVLRPLSDAPLQAYLDERVQLYDIIEKILLEVGKADIYISTFSTSEEFLRRIFKLRSAGLIKSATLLTDLKASRKTLNLYQFISNVFDRVYLSENHSKVILIENAHWFVSICTSQNQTRGNRYESGMISTDQALYVGLYNQFISITNNKAISINDLLR